MLNRKITSVLDKFALEGGRNALLVTGARQVGKTFSIREFAKRHYDSYLEIYFIRDLEALKIFRDVSAEGSIVYAPVYASMFIRPRALPEKFIYPVP